MPHPADTVVLVIPALIAACFAIFVSPTLLKYTRKLLNMLSRYVGTHRYLIS